MLIDRMKSKMSIGCWGWGIEQKQAVACMTCMSIVAYNGIAIVMFSAEWPDFIGT